MPSKARRPADEHGGYQRPRGWEATVQIYRLVIVGALCSQFLLASLVRTLYEVNTLLLNRRTIREYSAYHSGNQRSHFYRHTKIVFSDFCPDLHHHFFASATFRYALASYGTTGSPDGHRTPNQSSNTFHWHRTEALQKDLDRFDREPSFHVAALLPFSNLAKKLPLDRLVRVGINS